MFSSAGEIKRFAPLQDHAAAERVILVHGLLMSGHVMLLLARYLARQGFASILYDYPTRRATVDEHGGRVLPHSSRKKFQGRLILRGRFILSHTAWAGFCSVRAQETFSCGMGENRQDRDDRAAEQGFRCCGICAEKSFFCRKNREMPADLSSVPHSFANTFPEPDSGFDIGIIGGRYDLDVRESSTHLTHERDHMMLPHAHTTLLFSRRTAEQARHFIVHGRFERVEKEKGEK